MPKETHDTNSSLTPLDKQKLVLSLLAADPALDRKHSQFRDCIHHIPHFSSRLYSLTMTTETAMIRCGLKRRCPKCMDTVNVVAARRKDFQAILKTARELGAGERGERARVWLLSGRFSGRFGGSRLVKLLGRRDRRHQPAIRGSWAGESVTVRDELGLLLDCNGPNSSPAFVFNSLVFGGPDTELDEERLRAKGIEVLALHRKLESAWHLYLNRWAKAQISNQQPDTIVKWMTASGRMFETLGELRGVAAQEQSQHLDKLHATMGASTRLGFWNRLEHYDAVLARIARDLPLNASNLLNRPITQREMGDIMAKVRPQVKNVLDPAMTADDLPRDRPMTTLELRGRLDEILEESRKLRKALEGDPDGRVAPPPDKIM